MPPHHHPAPQQVFNGNRAQAAEEVGEGKIMGGKRGDIGGILKIIKVYESQLTFSRKIH